MFLAYKAIVFDFNGVFVPAPEKKILYSVCEKIRVGKWIALSNYYLNIWAFERGFLSPEQFWKKVFVSITEKEYTELIVKEYEKSHQKNSLLFMFAKDLAKKFDLYILSNSNFLQGKTYRKQKLYSNFKELFLSYEQGEIKPFPTIFQKFLNKTGFEAKECIFIDDSTLNVLVSMALGFKGLVYQDNQDLEEKLKALKVL